MGIQGQEDNKAESDRSNRRAVSEWPGVHQGILTLDAGASKVGGKSLFWQFGVDIG